MARTKAAVVCDDFIVAQRSIDGLQGIADALPGMVCACLAEARLPARELDAVAVIIGPGSFTGLRASIALAQGVGLAAAVPVHGISLTEAFFGSEAASGARADHRPLWIAVTARRGRVFLEREGVAASYADEELPLPAGAIAIAGDQAEAVAARLAAAGHDVLLTTARYSEPLAMAKAIRARCNAGLSPRLAIPAYVDPPEAKLPANGLRLPPAPR
jgi:tRNA threonylcarbamoyladenosine biosynthesis protein TsaB